MSFPAKTTFTLDWTTVPDVPTPGTYTAAQLKSMFNQRDQELLDFVNSILATLTAVTPGSSGADNIASAPITGVAGSAVYAQLVDLKNQLNGVVLGQIPDASLDYVKINAATQNLLTEYGVARQAIINGNFDVWTRGTTFSSPPYNTFTADRFNETGDSTVGTYTISRQAFTPGQTAVPNNPKYFYRHDQTVAGAGQTFRNLQHKIENGSLFAGSTFIVSFYAKADSARSVNINAYRNYGTGGSPTAQEQLVATSAIALTASWQKFTFVVATPSVTGKTFGSNGDDYLLFTISMPLNTTFTMDIAQIQVNSGNTALPFQPRSFADEKRLSEWFYERQGFGLSGVAISATSIAVPLKFTKRTTPTISLLTTTPAVVVNGAFQTGAGSALSVYGSTSSTGAVVQITGFTGMVIGNTVQINQADIIAIDGEL